MKKGRYILAIDHGTSGIKTAIVDTTGHVLDFEFEKTKRILAATDLMRVFDIILKNIKS